jgi:hypothetical protein
MYRAENRAGARPTGRSEGEGATYVLGAGKVVRTGQRSAPAPTRPNKRHREDRAAIDASRERLLERIDDNSPGAQYLRAAAEAQLQRANGTERPVTSTSQRHVATPAAINALGYDPNRPPENSARRAALIASLTGPVDRTKLVRKPRQPTPDMIDLD